MTTCMHVNTGAHHIMVASRREHDVAQRNLLFHQQVDLQRVEVTLHRASLLLQRLTCPRVSPLPPSIHLEEADDGLHVLCGVFTHLGDGLCDNLTERSGDEHAKRAVFPIVCEVFLHPHDDAYVQEPAQMGDRVSGRARTCAGVGKRVAGLGGRGRA